MAVMPGGGTGGAANAEVASYLQRQGISVPGGTGVLPGEPMVYMGQQRRFKTPIRSPGGGEARDFVSGGTSPRSVDRVIPLEQAALQWNRMTAEQQKRFAERLVAEGLLPADYTYAQAKAAWVDFVKEAADFYAAGKKVTPWDVIGMYAGAPGKGGLADEQQFPFTQTQTSVNLTDADTARAMLSSMLSQQLGRAAREEEVDDFVTALHGAQRANPNVTRTTYTDENTSTSETSGGVDAGAFAQQYAMGDQFGPEAGAYQAATTYFDALLAAIGPTTGR